MVKEVWVRGSSGRKGHWRKIVKHHRSHSRSRSRTRRSYHRRSYRRSSSRKETFTLQEARNLMKTHPELCKVRSHELSVDVIIKLMEQDLKVAVQPYYDKDDLCKQFAKALDINVIQQGSYSGNSFNDTLYMEQNSRLLMNALACGFSGWKPEEIKAFAKDKFGKDLSGSSKDELCKEVEKLIQEKGLPVLHPITNYEFGLDVLKHPSECNFYSHEWSMERIRNYLVNVLKVPIFAMPPMSANKWELCKFAEQVVKNSNYNAK